MPQALEPQKLTVPPQLVVSASASEPTLTLAPWDSQSSEHQQWKTNMPYQGGDHRLQIGPLGADGAALCESTNAGCCLSVHTDIVPDGDGGWALTMAAVAACLVYVAGGLYIGRRRGLKTHIHIEQSRQVWGLVRDGCAFARGGFRLPPASMSASSTST